MAYKREEQIYQPEKCLRCKRVIGADCLHGKEIFKHKDRFAVVEFCAYDPLYPITGEKR